MSNCNNDFGAATTMAIIMMIMKFSDDGVVGRVPRMFSIWRRKLLKTENQNQGQQRECEVI